MGKKFNLNYGWKFKPGFSRIMLGRKFDDSGFETVDLPHSCVTLPYNNFDDKRCQMDCVYRKAITPPEEYSRCCALLRFEGVANYAKVYVNGEYVAEHKGPYTPFMCDISEFLEFGAKNVIAVYVDSNERPEIPPFGNVTDFLSYGGIYREVTLEFTNKLNISDIFVYCEDPLAAEPRLAIQARFSQSLGCARFYFELFDKNGELALSRYPEDDTNVNSSAWRDTDTFTRAYPIKSPMLWSIDEPNLYVLHAYISSNGMVVDEKYIKVGLRSAEFRQDGFYLNDKKIKLLGLSRYQSYPYAGFAMPKSIQAMDADILKFKLGVNAVRAANYPQSSAFLDRCDEIGLLVIDEVPGWQHVGKSEWLDNLCDATAEMIIRDRNHPSVILYDVRVNQSFDFDSLYRRTNDIAYDLDPTRQTGGARNIKNSHFLEDVYTYNDFSYRGYGHALEKPDDVCGPDAPYLVTAYAGEMFPCKRFDDEEHRIEHVMRHARAIDQMYGDERYSGAIGWCFADYNSHAGFGSGDRICYYGVTDMFRIPKMAAYLYASQLRTDPVLEVTSSLFSGDHPARELKDFYVLTNCDSVRLYKNNRYVAEFFPDREDFPHMPHPPIKVDDVIGDVLVSREGYKEETAAQIKRLMLEISRSNGNPTREHLETAARLSEKDVSMGECVRLYYKYVGNWGLQNVVYRFDGVTNGKVAISVVRSNAPADRLVIKPDRTTLTEGDTYDAVRVAIYAVNADGVNAPYAMNALKLTASGAVSLIGPSLISLKNGAIACFLRTNGAEGHGTLSIDSDDFGQASVSFEVSIAPGRRL